MLAELGAHLFVQGYGATHPEPTLSRYLAASFRAKEIATALRRGDACILLAESSAGEPIGYARLAEANLPPAAELISTCGLEIERFYVEQGWHGIGVAQQLMAGCQEEARSKGSDLLWLQVWQEAPRPIAFYQRQGFRIVGTTTFAFGERIDTDWLMAREV